MACNCLLGNTVSLNEIVRINLLNSYCLPILQYATAALKLNKSQSSELNACWNFVYRKIFGFHKHESVRSFIQGLGLLDFTHIRMLLMYKLICKSLQCHNYSLSVLARLSIMSKDFKNMCCYVGLSSNISNLVSPCKFKALLYECCKL